MSTAALVPVEEYLRYSEKPNAEYRDGVLYPKAMPTLFHAIVQYALITLLRARGLQAVAELTVQVAPSRYLVPDVAAAKRLTGPYPTEPVLLCIEVLSPDDRLGAMLAKCEEYHAWGVPYCWIVDPLKRTGWEFHSGSEPTRAGDSLQAGEVSVPLAEVFAELPEA